MIASVHIADVGPRAALAFALNGRRRTTDVPGLRDARVALAAPLGGALRPKPDLGRAALIGFRDDDAALDAFLATNPVAATIADGWHVRLVPLRAFGAWPGLPEDLLRSRHVDHDGPAAVLTLGRLRLGRAVPFLRASAKAEARVLDAPGLIWASGLGKPPFVATCSLWESADAAAAYAFTDGDAHHDAIVEDRAKPFHHMQAFVRFRPYATVGALGGSNPLAADWLVGV
jgi:hypothetical protein